MTVQRGSESSAIALAERVHELEDRVTSLTDAVRVLAHGLEDLPTSEPGGRPAATAARRAYDLLLVSESRQPDGQSGTGQPAN